ncbi:MAG: type II toxin-antitoxin system RelE/ParE family toxin [Acidimicrobiales bacterium]
MGLLNRLTSTDPPLPFPHSSQVDGQLRELRCHYGRDLDRILYQRSGNLFVLLHAIEKRTGALPAADIEIARARFEDFKNRMDAKPRRRPRAARHDPP